MLLPARNMGDDAFDACLVRSITSAQTRQRETELAAKQLFAVKLLQSVLTRKAQGGSDMPATHQATSKISDVAGTNLAMLGTRICQARNTLSTRPVLTQRRLYRLKGASGQTIGVAQRTATWQNPLCCDCFLVITRLPRPARFLWLISPR